MIKRFSFYGFLKNQIYFAPFFIIILRAKGLTFFEIGLIVGFQHFIHNVLEVPSGVLADFQGRKTTLIFGWGAYIISFILYFFLNNVWLLMIAALFYGIGEAFRSGTHKAIIFSWLKSQNRADERTRVYGYTRSWSQTGSAASVVIVAIVLIGLKLDLQYLFLLTIIPYLFGLINFFGYPESLNKDSLEANYIYSVSGFIKELMHSLKLSLSIKQLRSLIIESLSFDSSYRLSIPYFQIILQITGLTWGSLAIIKTTDSDNAAIFILTGYFLIYILNAIASKNAHKIVSFFQSENFASRLIWMLNAVLFSTMALAIWFKLYFLSALLFLPVGFLYNLWRPIYLSRFDKYAPKGRQATMLSIESQAKSLFLAGAAPLVGYGVDHFSIVVVVFPAIFFSLIYSLKSK